MRGLNLPLGGLLSTVLARLRRARTVLSSCAAEESTSTNGGRHLGLMALQGCDASPPLSTTIFDGLPFLLTTCVRGHLWLAELQYVVIGAASARGFGVRARHGRDTEADRRRKCAPIEAVDGLPALRTCLFRGE